MNKLFTMIFIVLLSLPISTWAVDSNIETDAPIVSTIEEKEVEQDLKEESPYKKPISKRKIAKKFLYAMGGVALSSFAIFFLLTVYNKIRERYLGQTGDFDSEMSLETPSDLNNAIKVFLNKTGWK